MGNMPKPNKPARTEKVHLIVTKRQLKLIHMSLMFTSGRLKMVCLSEMQGAGRMIEGLQTFHVGDTGGSHETN